MRLSLCLITRNEQENLPRALKSFQGACDEIVIADTGSTDQTVAIAHEFGARVIPFPWIDDFSAARNYCVSHARGEWVFWLDADEELLPESRDVLQKCVAREDALAWHVLRQDLLRSDRADLFTEMWQLRLFRRDVESRFVGRCHPDFCPPLDQLARRRRMAVLGSPIRLRHWGYVAEMKVAKLERSLRLLKMELDDRPDQLYYQVEYGRTLLALGQQSEAMCVFEKAASRMLQDRDQSRPPNVMAAALLECLMALPEAQVNRLISREEIFELCDRWFPSSAPLLWAISRLSFQAGDFAEAALRLRKLIQLGQDDRYDKSISFDPRLIREDAVLNLAACSIRLAELDEAEALLCGLLSSPRRAKAEQNLAVITQIRQSMQSD